MDALEPQIILITGGCRSGKSRMALSLCTHEHPKVYVATAQPRDLEMRQRIRRHREERSREWLTIEEQINLYDVLCSHRKGSIVVDCLTLWFSNLMENRCSEVEMKQLVDQLIYACREREGKTVFVTNEVGMGIVPENPLGREFRDLAGSGNQQIAMSADRVILMVSGLPIDLKDRT